MEFGISWGRSNDVEHARYEEYLEVPEGMIRVTGTHVAVLLNESRYLLLRLVKSIVALGLYGIALVMLAYATLGGLLSVLSGFQGKGWIGPVAIVWVPVALVGSYVLAALAILCTEKYTRGGNSAPGVVEIICPACSRETPLFKSCAECGIGFIFPDPQDGILIGLLRILNWCLSAFWYILCAAGVLILILGMI